MAPPDRRRFAKVAARGTGLSERQMYTASGVGCRFRCRNCATPHLFPGRSVRSPQSVAEEWRQLLQENHSIWDTFEDFTGDLSWLQSLCAEIKRRGLAQDIGWSSFGNARDFTINTSQGQHMLELLSQSGYNRRMVVGIESANPDTLQRLGRPNSFEDVVCFLDMAEQSGIEVWGTVMIGYPWEDEKGLRQSLEASVNLPLSFLTIFFFMPLPGTPLYTECRHSGTMAEGVSFSDFTGGVPILRTPVAPNTLRRLRLEYLQRFYARNHQPESEAFARAISERLGEKHEKARLYSDRTAGGDSHYRHPSSHPLPGVCKSTGEGEADKLPQ